LFGLLCAWREVLILRQQKAKIDNATAKIQDEKD
jgi:hypothetical protein